MFSNSVPSLVFYSHISLLIICSFFILQFVKHRKDSIKSNLIIIFLISFNLWVLFSLIFWVNNDPAVMMVIWSWTILVEPIIYISCVYLNIVLISNKDISINYKFLLLIIYYPIIILLPTKLTLLGFNHATNLSIEGPIGLYYSYSIEIIYLIFTIIYSVYNLYFYKNNRNDIKLISFGIIFFLTLFSIGNITGSFTNNWKLGEFGLLGMPIFIAILIYDIVKFDLFEIRLILRNILIFSLWILVGSLITITDLQISHFVIGITFIISLILGIILIKSGNRESKHLETISSLANELSIANSSLSERVNEQTEEINHAYEIEKKSRRDLQKLSETKDQFIMIAQHNLRIPVTNIDYKLKKYFENQDKNNSNNKDLKEIYDSIEHLKHIADDFKNIAKMKSESQILNLNKTNIYEMIISVLNELKIDAENMNIKINIDENINKLPQILIDNNKIKEVLTVIIENAIKYNKQNGKIDIKSKIDEGYIKLEFFNTGIGINSEEKEKLFNSSFYRSKRTKEINPIGMGIGLSLSKTIVEAHRGNLTIESEGESMGALVKITLPISLNFKYQ